MAGLTTHILDTARGCPAAGVRLEVFRVTGEKTSIASATTNRDGRCDAPLVRGEDLTAGRYEIVFSAGDYLRRHFQLAEPLFLDHITIAFGVSEPDGHYHVPLLLSPFGYSTYRGS